MAPILSQAPKFYVVDVLDVIEQYQYEHFINQMFPQLTIHGFIAIIMSDGSGPGRDEEIIFNVQKAVGEKFDVLADVQSIEQAALDICESIDIKFRTLSVICHHGTPYFWKWLDQRTLVLAHHHDPFIQQQIQRASIAAMENYIYTTSSMFRS